MARSLAVGNSPVVSMDWLEKRYGEDYEQSKKVFKDGNFHAIMCGKTGSGKDSISQALIDVDVEQGRTIIIIDLKGEYTTLCFPQQDTVLKNILHKNNVITKSYEVQTFCPYAYDTYDDEDFREQLNINYPKRKFRPFRLWQKELTSQDTKNSILGLSKLQTFADTPEARGMLGASRQGLMLKEKAGRKFMIMDDYDLRSEGCGWEYLDFKELLTNQKINVIDLFYMYTTNKLSAISTAIGIMNEVLSRAMRQKSGEIALYIPEIQLLQPEGVKYLEDQVKMLMANLIHSFLLMRSFGCKNRINLQNLFRLNKSIFNQANIYCGRTQSSADIKILRQIVPDHVLRKIKELPVGKFYSVEDRTFFSVVGKAHKAGQNQNFLTLYKQFYANPENFLYNYHGVYSSDIMDSFTDKKMLTVNNYKAECRAWLKELNKDVKSIERINLDIAEESRFNENFKQRVKEGEEKRRKAGGRTGEFTF